MYCYNKGRKHLFKQFFIGYLKEIKQNLNLSTRKKKNPKIFQDYSHLTLNFSSLKLVYKDGSILSVASQRNS